MLQICNERVFFMLPSTLWSEYFVRDIFFYEEWAPKFIVHLLCATYNYKNGNLWNDTKSIDRLHKWRPKEYYFLFMLIRLTSLFGTYKIQKKCSFRTRLVGLISRKSKEYFLAAIYAIGLYRVMGLPLLVI